MNESIGPIDIKKLEIAVRAASKITGERTFVIVGAAALSGTIHYPPSELLYTEDVDLYPEGGQDEDDMEQLDSLLGLGSKFESRHGFYVQRVGEWTLMTQPAGWRERSSKCDFGDCTGICLGLLDLAYNKLEAAREKDFLYVGEMLRLGIVNSADLREFITRGNESPGIVEENLGRLEIAEKSSQERMGVPEKIETIQLIQATEKSATHLQRSPASIG